MSQPYFEIQTNHRRAENQKMEPRTDGGPFLGQSLSLHGAG
jgi:hypothetical protein